MSAMALFSIAMLRVSVTGTKRLCAVEQNNKRRKHVGKRLVDAGDHTCAHRCSRIHTWALLSPSLFNAQ